MATKTKKQRNTEREQIGERLEADLDRFRGNATKIMEKLLQQQTRELLQQLGVSQEWKQQTVAALRLKATTGELEPIIAHEQIALVTSLEVTQ